MAPLFLGWNTNFWKAGKVLGTLFSAQQLKFIPGPPAHSFPLLHQKLHAQGENFVLSQFHNVLGTPSPCWLVKSHLRSDALPDTFKQIQMSHLCFCCSLCTSIYWLSYCKADPWTHGSYRRQLPHSTQSKIHIELLTPPTLNYQEPTVHWKPYR